MKSLHLATIAVLFLSSGCVTGAKVVHQNDQIYTLEYATGSKGQDIPVYQESFEKKAQEVCKGKEYDVLEKSFKPSTLKGAEGVLRPENYYWVVKCK